MAVPIDTLFWSMVALCGLVAAAVFAAMAFYCVRYRHGSRADRAGMHQQSMGVEITWTLLPFALFVGVFIWSLMLYTQARTPPADSQTIYIVAKQWMWTVQHPGGQREINALHVPLGVPIRLTMTSQDAIHSFYVPAFRVKQDVLPGRYTQLWFTATRLGQFSLLCAEYCGADHSKMGGLVVVLRPAEYGHWLESHGGLGLSERGRQLFESRGCNGCHDAGSPVHAPMLRGLYGRPVQLTDGSTVIADDRYLRDAILLPQSQRVAGFPPVMPAFAGQIDEEELLALLAYVKSDPSASAGTP